MASDNCLHMQIEPVTHNNADSLRQIMEHAIGVTWGAGGFNSLCRKVRPL